MDSKNPADAQADDGTPSLHDGPRAPNEPAPSHAPAAQQEKLPDLPVPLSYLINLGSAVRMSLFFGVLSVLCSVMPCINVMLAIGAIVLGHIARLIVAPPTDPAGPGAAQRISYRRKAAWGLGLGYAGLVLSIVLMVVIFGSALADL